MKAQSNYRILPNFNENLGFQKKKNDELCEKSFKIPYIRQTCELKAKF